MGLMADMGRSLAGRDREVVRAHLARGPQESRAFAFLMIGNIVVFVAQWPRLGRVSGELGVEFEPIATYTLVSLLFVWPIAFYGVAQLVHGASRLLGGQGDASGARLALFWSWLAASPLALVAGTVAALVGRSPLVGAAGAAWLLAFAVLWARAQREAAAPRPHAA